MIAEVRVNMTVFKDNLLKSEGFLSLCAISMKTLTTRGGTNFHLLKLH